MKKKLVITTLALTLTVSTQALAIGSKQEPPNAQTGWVHAVITWMKA